MHLANFPSYLTTPLQKISGLKYFLTNVRSWVFKCLSSGLTTHNEQIFLGLPDLTIVENPHAHAHLCKSWKQLHYRTCWVQANLCLFAHSSVQKHNWQADGTPKSSSLANGLLKFQCTSPEFEVWTSVVRVLLILIYPKPRVY
jgi:hypothetical protein